MKILAPSPGESITEIVIAQWLKQDQKPVQKNEKIAEMESEKATLEIVSEIAGILHIKKSAGESVTVGDVIAEVVPDTDKHDDDASSVGDAVAGVASGTDKHDDDASPVGDAVAGVASGTEKDNAHAASLEKSPDKKYPSPAASKILAERDMTPEQIAGTGKDGRITKADALNATPPMTVSPQASPPTDNAPSAPAPIDHHAKTHHGDRTQHRVKMSFLRKKISARLVGVKNETAMLTTFNEVDMTAVMSVRSKYKESFMEKHKTGLGFMSFFTKACTIALAEFPTVNGMIDNDEIVTPDYVDMSIAVSTPKGLMVPVIRNTEKQSLAEIEKQIVDLATKARGNTLTLTEMTGGTFTITNGGVFGSMLSTPIINPPQSAILGMHNIINRPVAVNGAVEIRPIMYIALSYDHRIIDGRESVGFLVRVKQLIEDPVRLLLVV